jgi:hypothetical protein
LTTLQVDHHNLCSLLYEPAKNGIGFVSSTWRLADIQLENILAPSSISKRLGGDAGNCTTPLAERRKLRVIKNDVELLELDSIPRASTLSCNRHPYTPDRMPSTAFEPPSAEGKPDVPKWIPPQPTQEELDWASLHTIDLSLLDSPAPQVVEDLVQLTKKSISEDGFLYLVNYGVSIDQLSRQFDLAQYLHRNISDEDKDRLLWVSGYSHLRLSIRLIIDPKPIGSRFWSFRWASCFVGQTAQALTINSFKRKLGWKREAGEFDG